MVAKLTLVLLLAACSGAERPIGNPARIGLKMTDATMTDAGDRVDITMRLQLLGVPGRVAKIRLDVASVDGRYVVDRNGGSIVVQPDAHAVDVHFDVMRTAPGTPPPSSVNLIALVSDSQYGEQRQDFRFAFPWGRRAGVPAAIAARLARRSTVTRSPLTAARTAALQVPAGETRPECAEC